MVELLGSLQSSNEAKCTLAVKSIQCELYYCPNSDDVNILNQTLRTITETSSSGTTGSVRLFQTFTLSPAYWNLSHQNDTVYLNLLARCYFLSLKEKNGTPHAVRRPADEGISEPSAKRAKTPAGARAYTTNSKAASRSETPTMMAWAGVNLGKDQLVRVTDAVTGDVGYTLPLDKLGL